MRRDALGRGARALLVAACALLPALARAQSPTGTVAVPSPQAGRGAAERADAASLADGASAGRLTDAQLQQGVGASATPPRPTAEDVRSAEGVQIFVMTVGQGTAVWERFGHNALWIRDPARGTDLAYNWGTFDFAQPNFLGRFLSGDTQYWVEGIDARLLAEHYARVENRSVIVQELAMSAQQKAELRAYVEWNAQDAHKFYRYDYYRDNCSTRVRDAIDRALGGAVRRALAGVPTGTTYRSHTRRLVAGDAATYTGIQLALGRPADVPIDAWQESFLPVQLMEHLRRVRVAGPTGAAVPLVLHESTFYEAQREPERRETPSYALLYGLAGVLIAALLLLVGRWSAAGRRGADAALGVVGGVWTLVFGLLGTALVLAGTITRHTFMGRNENLLAVSPLALVLLVLLALAVGTRRADSRARWRGRATTVAAVLAALTVGGALLTALPAVGQQSVELFALLVPVHVALWWALRGGRAVRRTA